jgi:hypothetical protein
MQFASIRGNWRLAGSAFAVAALLATGHAEASVQVRSQAASYARTASGPPACARQRTMMTYGGHSQGLNVRGGSFCIPAFGGFGGSLEYPGVERAVELSVRTTTEDIYNEPLLGTGTPIVYLNLHFHAGTHFGPHLRARGGLTSAAIQAGQAYTAYGIFAVGHLSLMFPPCYAVATQGAYGGVLANIGDLFTNAPITGAGFGVIEIYPGTQVSQPC